jgi:hypothetical protein
VKPVQYQDIDDFIELVVLELQRRGTTRLPNDHPGHRFGTHRVEASH